MPIGCKVSEALPLAAECLDGNIISVGFSPVDFVQRLSKSSSHKHRLHPPHSGMFVGIRGSSFYRF